MEIVDGELMLPELRADSPAVRYFLSLNDGDEVVLEGVTELDRLPVISGGERDGEQTRLGMTLFPDLQCRCTRAAGRGGDEEDSGESGEDSGESGEEVEEEDHGG